VIPGLEHRTFRTRDGATLAYQIRGAADRPAIVLSNGLGGTFEAFTHLYQLLGDRYRIVCWDYRGLYRSSRPADLATLSIPAQAEDLRELLDHEEIDRAVLIGWSMGVQVNFELARRHRERMVAIVVLSGTYGTPFRTALASRLARYVIPPALAVMKARAPIFSRVSQVAVAWAGLLPAMMRLGLIADRIDRDAMMAVVADFKTLDFAIYADTLRRLGEHDARDLLAGLGLPTLIITGDRDLMTPVFTARKMNRLVAGSRLVILPGASHYAPLEYPGIINDEVRRFLAEIPGWEPV
jgi:3-oxoadipate enol-lactonase